MKLELDVYNAICEAKTFEVNGIKATYRDFGVKYDSSPDKGKPNCCGNMIFEPIDPTGRVLAKYGISRNEYNHICILLEDCFSVGTCRLCG